MAGKKEIRKLIKQGIPLTSSEESDSIKRQVDSDLLEEPVEDVPYHSEEWWEDVYSGIDREKPLLPPEDGPTDPRERAQYLRRMKERKETIERDREFREKERLRKRLGR